jgi:hypothetical protein
MSSSWTVRGRDPIVLRGLQPIAQQLGWEKQREMWRELLDQRKTE